MTIGWKFPSSGGGTEAGFNDSGIETYAGQPFENLAREIIQNSLDARESKEKPVIVAFQVEEIPAETFPGHSRMLDTMEKCLKESKNEEKAKNFFTKAVKILKGQNITCLKILDYNTTGLCGDSKTGQWHRLVKTTGQSAKDSNTAGGSYGIGKNAPFAVSNLRTVFYSTRYKGNNSFVERAQGKAILVSHKISNGDFSQAVGFYGIEQNCEKLTNDSIPKLLRRTGENNGTTLLIPGLSESDKWQEKIIAAVIANYFYAIYKKDLEVLIDHHDSKYCLINAETLPALLADKNIREMNEDVQVAESYYRAIVDGDKKETTLPTLKHCIMWVVINEGYSQSVAILRQGMKITDNQKGLRRWVSCADFVAVVMCDSNDGNALLRKMENPTHNAFEPDRLENKSKLGKKAINELTKWIKDEIKNLADQPESDTVPLVSMSRFFPSPDDDLPGENPEKDIEGDSSVKMKPVNLKPLPLPVIDIDEEGEGEVGAGEEEGEFHRSENNGGDGGGDNGRSNGGDNVVYRPMKIEAVRILPEENSSNIKIMFTPKQTGRAILYLKIAGDSFFEDISISSISSIVKGDNATVKDGKIMLDVKQDNRIMLIACLAESINNAALSVSLSQEVSK